MVVNIVVSAQPVAPSSGMVLAIEPMVNAGSAEVLLSAEDGWTARTRDGSLRRPGYGLKPMFRSKFLYSSVNDSYCMMKFAARPAKWRS